MLTCPAPFRALGLCASILLSSLGVAAGVTSPQEPPLISCVLDVVWGDGNDNDNGMRATCTTVDGRVFRVQTDDEFASRINRGELRLGQTVRIRVPPDAAVNELQVHSASISAAPVSATAALTVLESRKWATVLCRYADSPGLTPTSPATFQVMMGNHLGGLAGYWEEVSYRRLQLDASTVLGWINLPNARSFYVTDLDGDGDQDFKTGQFASDCIGAVDKDLLVTDYLGFTVVANTGDLGSLAGGGRAAGFGGSGFLNFDGVSRSYRLAWIGQFHIPTIVAHEMGHAFGLPHIRSPSGGASQWDVMANPQLAPGGEMPHVIAAHKERLEWIPPGLVRSVAGKNATFILPALSDPAAETTVSARVPLSDGTWYSVEARRRVRNDIATPADGVLIHHVDPNRADIAELKSRTGDGAAGAAWRVGDVFRDQARGINIRVNAAAGNGYSVTLSHGGLEKPFGVVDTPADGASVAGAVAVTGWALGDLGVAAVKIYRNPMPGEPTHGNGHVFIGDATLVSGSRPDIQSAFAEYPGSDRAGWGLMVLSNMLPRGGSPEFTLYAYAVDAAEQTTLLGTKRIQLRNDNSKLPFGTIDTPGQGELVAGIVANFGWALAPQPNSIPADGSTIGVYVDGMFVGRPTYGLHREDIAALFPGLANSNGAIGFYLLDTTQLSNGVHTIAWLVTDSAGNAEGIGSRFFTVDNARTTLFNNRNDPHLASVTRKGITFDFYGNKDVDGLPLATSSLKVLRDGRETRVDFFNGALKSVYSPEGFSFALAADGGVLATGPSGTTYPLPPLKTQAAAVGIEATAAASPFPGYTVGVRVTSCGEPVAQTIPLTMIGMTPAGVRIGEYPATRQGDSDRYIASIPTVDPFAYSNVKSACTSTLGKAWDGVCALPQDVAQAFVAESCTALATVLTPAAGAACAVALEGLLLACNLQVSGDDVCTTASQVVSPFLSAGYILRVSAGRQGTVSIDTPITDTSLPMPDIAVDIGGSACEGKFRGGGVGPIHVIEARNFGFEGCPVSENFARQTLELSAIEAEVTDLCIDCAVKQQIGVIQMTVREIQEAKPACGILASDTTRRMGYTIALWQGPTFFQIRAPVSIIRGELRGNVMALTFGVPESQNMGFTWRGENEVSTSLVRRRQQ